MTTIGCISFKGEGNVFNSAMSGIVTVFCVSSILKTWLKTLIVITAGDNENNSTVIIVNGPKNSTQAEAAQPKEAAQEPEEAAEPEKEGEIKEN